MSDNMKKAEGANERCANKTFWFAMLRCLVVFYWRLLTWELNAQSIFASEKPSGC